MSPTPRLMSDKQRDVIVNLHISDQQTRGHPALRTHEIPVAQDWLPQLLTDSDKLGEHVALLAELYRSAFRPPAPRRDRQESEPPVEARPVGFTHCELLPEDRASAVAERGPDVLSDD